MRRRFLAALLGTALLAPIAARADRPEWEALRGRPIADVRVDPAEVFDPTQKGENHFVFEWANWVHIRTRPHVIRREYRQEIGDPFDPQLAEECERNLRNLAIFQNVRLDAGELGDDVEVVLHTTDRWTTQLNPVIRSQGGVNQIGLAVGERNILGLGFEMGGSAIYSNDVSEASVYWRDRRLFGSRWDSGIDLRSDDLGRGQFFHLGHPFYSDALRWTADASAAFTDGQARFFEAGQETARLPVSEDQFEASYGVHHAGAALQRVALFFSRRDVRGDFPNETSTVGITWAAMQRRFGYRRGVDRIGIDEEVAAGWSVQVGAGADLKALGADADRAFYRVDGGWSTSVLHPVWGGVLIRHQGFLNDSDFEQGRISAEVFGGWQTPRVQTLAWRLGGDAFIDDLPYFRFNLGSDDRLRGYPARELNGTRTLYGSLEERLFSGRRVLFMRLGAVAFVDAAVAWDDGETMTRDSGRLAGGFGLRIGTDPAGSNVTRVDFGFGKNSFELAISSGAFFDVARGLGFAGMSVFH